MSAFGPWWRMSASGSWCTLPACVTSRLKSSQRSVFVPVYWSSSVNTSCTYGARLSGALRKNALFLTSLVSEWRTKKQKHFKSMFASALKTEGKHFTEGKHSPHRDFQMNLPKLVFLCYKMQMDMIYFQFETVRSENCTYLSRMLSRTMDRSRRRSPETSIWPIPCCDCVSQVFLFSPFYSKEKINYTKAHRNHLFLSFLFCIIIRFFEPHKDIDTLA